MTLLETIAALNGRYAGLATSAVLHEVLTGERAGKIALVSSFGSESAVMLSLVAEVAPATPVLFIDTGKHFGETLRYRDQLVKRLGLSDVRRVMWTPQEAEAGDPDGMLYASNPDQCCFLRKVQPLARALAPFEGWINGRKGHHGAGRAALPLVEADGPRLKFNPLARWTADDVAAHFAIYDLPAHPLVEDGYRSIGCFTCSRRVTASDDLRAGRWAGSDKVECGIHTVLSEVTNVSEVAA